jgi:predicted transcriptional regulator
VAAASNTGTVVQAWVSPDLARRLKAQAEAERRSVSQTIRLAVEDRLREQRERRDA